MKIKALLLFITISFTVKALANPYKHIIPTIMIENDSLLRHTVFFKFKESTKADQIKKIEKAFSALPSKIEQIKGYEWGLNNSPEGLNKGFTHAFFLTFKSEEDRAIYLPHPDHKAFVALLTPILEDVFVVDYWTKQ